MSKGSETTLQEIAQMHEMIQEANHYEVLGLDRMEFDASKLGALYRGLAKKWHMDRLNALELSDEDKLKAQQIFSAITQAHRTLSSEEKRLEYDEEIDAGEGMDVTALLEADSIFLRGKNTLAQGSYSGAYDMFNEAHSLNPEDRHIIIHQLYTEFMLLPKKSGGTPINMKRAEDIYNALDEFHEAMEDEDWFKVFLGGVAEGVGKDRRAIYLYREALMINPSNREAQRQKRIFEMRKEKQANPSFMDRLKGLFGK
jgi:curved DNA-binding protein CbpA